MPFYHFSAMLLNIQGTSISSSNETAPVGMFSTPGRRGYSSGKREAMRWIYQAQEQFIPSSISFPKIHFSLPFLCTLAKQNLGFAATCTLGACVYQVLPSSLIQGKSKVTFTQAKYIRVHTKNMLNTCPILPPLGISLLSSTWRKRTYTKILQNCQHAHHGNQQACVTVASLVALLRIPSTI